MRLCRADRLSLGSKIVVFGTFKVDVLVGGAIDFEWWWSLVIKVTMEATLPISLATCNIHVNSQAPTTCKFIPNQVQVFLSDFQECLQECKRLNRIGRHDVTLDICVVSEWFSLRQNKGGKWQVANELQDELNVAWSAAASSLEMGAVMNELWCMTSAEAWRRSHEVGLVVAAHDDDHWFSRFRPQV